MEYRKICCSILFLLIVFSLHAQQINLPLFKVGIITDVQYCDADTRGTRNYRGSAEKLQDAASEFQKNKVDFIVSLGDFIDHDFQSFDPLLQILKQVNIPVHHVLGNHDFSVYEAQKEKIPAMLGLEKRYYSFTRGNWRFLCLDGTDQSVFSNKKGSPKTMEAEQVLASMKEKKMPNAQTWNGGIGEKQIRWIKEQLAQAEKAGENIVAMCHYPIFPENEMENLWNANEINNVLSQFPGKLVFLNGHTHRSDFHSNKGVCYVAFRGMVESFVNSFAIAEVYPDSIIIRGYGAEKDQVISWK